MIKDVFKKSKDALALRWRRISGRDQNACDESGARLWLAMLTIVAIVFVAGIVLHYRLFRSVFAPSALSEEADGARAVLDRDFLDRVLAQYKERERRYEEVLGSKPTALDPSR